MSSTNKITNKSSDNSSGIECISLESDDNNHNQIDCISIASDSMDEHDVQYFKSNIHKRFGGEDLCERADIQRRDGVIAIEDYNENYINIMLNKEREKDLQLESILHNIYESKVSDTDYNDSNDSNEESDEKTIDGMSALEKSNWTSNVFQKPIDYEEYIESQYSLDPVQFRLDACLRYRSDSALKVPLPFESISRAFEFNNRFMRLLNDLKCQTSSLQLHLWPCILKGFSLSCISGPKTGKTNAYMIPLMCWFDSSESYSEFKVGSIVICNSTRKTQQIAREAKKWRQEKGSKVRIVVLNTSNEKKQMTAILNGCDILITTPSPLLRCVQMNIIDSKDTRCLILDDADVSLALHMKVILDIYLAFAQSKKQIKSNHQNDGTEHQISDNSMAFQTLLFSEKWTRDVQWFYKEVQHIPVLIFGSYLEATIALSVVCNLEFIKEEQDREETLRKLLNSVQHKERVAIVCRTIEEIKYLKKILKLQLKSITVTEETNHFDLEGFSHVWKKGGKYLFVTDGVLKTLSGFDTSKCIIHYKLPYDFNDFGDRFRLMKFYFKKSKSPLNQQYTKDLVNYVLVSPEDKDELPQLVSYLKRLNVEIPVCISNLCQFNLRKLCPYFSSFGKCPIVSIHCFDRHVFNHFDRPNPHLPESGQIKFVISYVVGANEFFIRINEFRGENQSSGIWEKMDQTLDELRPKLNEYMNTDYNTLNDFSKDEVYGIAIRGEVLRVQITRQMGDEELYYYQEYDPNDVSQVLELFSIDYGHKFMSRSRKLFTLPQDLKSLPPFAHKAYLFGIKPVDNEIEWDFKSTQKFYELIDNFRITQITAWISRQVNGVFWLNKLNVKKKLKNAKTCVDSNPIETLIEEKLAVKHTNKLSQANNDYNKIVNIWHNNRLKGLSYNSKLNDDLTCVVVSDFVSTDEIYIMYENRVQRLEDLENKWLENSESLESLSELTEGQLCLYRYHDNIYDEYSINRAKILSINEDTVDLFLVDHGETIRTASKSSIYRIQDLHIKELPFQAIKVKLFGIKAFQTISYNLICQLTRDEEDKYRLIIAKRLKYENGIYTVRLFVAEDNTESQFVALTKLLVDLKLAQYIDEEEKNELNLKLNQFIDQQNDDELNDDYLQHIEKEMTDNFCKDFIMKSLNIKEEDDIDEDKEVKVGKKESQMSKVRKRLQAIKQKKALSQNICQKVEDEEEWTERPVYPENVDYKPGDFDYDYDKSGVAYYDDSDLLDNESLNSDEDAMFDEEDELA